MHLLSNLTLISGLYLSDRAEFGSSSHTGTVCVEPGHGGGARNNAACWLVEYSTLHYNCIAERHKETVPVVRRITQPTILTAHFKSVQHLVYTKLTLLMMSLIVCNGADCASPTEPPEGTLTRIWSLPGYRFHFRVVEREKCRRCCYIVLCWCVKYCSM